MVTLISECKHCQSDKIHYKENEFETGYYCQNCDIIHVEKKQFEGCCNYVDIQTMQVATANGFSYRNICQNCYSTIATIKKTDKPIGKLIDISLDELNNRKYGTNKNIIYGELLNLKNEFNKNKESAFWLSYSEYLKSDKWQLKRKKVLERDKYICQACLTNKAEQAHHLTYKNVFDEPLFQLTSVCIRCHDKLHEIDKKNRYGL